MFLIDSSVWIDYLKKQDTLACREMRRLLGSQPDQVAITEPIIMELLAGASQGRNLLQLEALTNGLPLCEVDGHVDYREAASIFRTARGNGRTVRKLIDCLIAAVAIRHEATLIHKDVDYEVISSVVELDALSWREG